MALELHGLAIPAGDGASQLVWLTKHWNSLPCGSAPAGTWSATHAHELPYRPPNKNLPKPSAMPLPHQAGKNSHGMSEEHGLSVSAWHAVALG